MKLRFLLLILAVLALGAGVLQAQSPVELRITWYDDGSEGVVLRSLLDQFEADNADIRVIVDTVAYNVILEQLPIQVAAGEGPDMARITDFAAFKGFYLDLRPLVADASYWEASFPEAVLNAMRSGEDDNGIYGFPNQFTISAPYINATLFEQAGIDIPTGDVSWAEWTEVAAQVAEATGTPYAIAIDRSGHRLAGPLFSSGAVLFNADGTITVDTPGFREMSQLLIDWHNNGLTPAEVWIGSGGSYAAAADFFINGQLVMYMSGSWQVGRFARDIGDAFDWMVVPNPTGPGGSTGMPGGTAFVAFAETDHPAEVARVMDYLASVDALRAFTEQTLFIPGHLGLGEINYATDSELAANALTAFVAEVPKLTDQAYELQYGGRAFAINNPIRDRLTQVITGELTLDEALARLQQDIDSALSS